MGWPKAIERTYEVRQNYTIPLEHLSIGEYPSRILGGRYQKDNHRRGGMMFKNTTITNLANVQTWAKRPTKLWGYLWGSCNPGSGTP
jgi:hypothetical protein